MRVRFTAAERRVFARRPEISVSQWAAEHVVMPDGPFSGARYRRDVNPYLVGIMDTWGRREVREIIVCGAPQIGKTALLDVCLCYSIAHRPGPRMLAMPDDETVARILDAKLLPMMKRTRPVRELLARAKAGRISFRDGTSLYLTSAASSSQRASISVQDLFLDEEALYAGFTVKGDPVLDLLERIRSYAWKAKVLRISKPVGDETTSIWADLAGMDEIRHYHVACPSCGAMQEMLPEHIVTEGGVKDPVRIRREKLGRYRCAHCHWHWNDAARDRAVGKGEWIATDPVTAPARVGFYLPAYLSAMVSLSEVAARRIECEQSDEAKVHQAYANGILAQPYKPVLAKTSVEKVMELVDKDLPPQTIPEGYQAVTIGVDMQKRGFWYVVCAWTGKLDCAIIDYGRLLNFDELYDLAVVREWPVQGSGDMVPAWRVAVDTGGGLAEGDFISRTEECYDFLINNNRGVIFGTKGASRRTVAPVQRTLLERFPRRRMTIAGGLPLFLIDTDYFKTWVSSRMTAESRQPLRLHSRCEESLAKQLTAEELVLERGKRVWKAVRRDNHYFDCLCLAMATVNAAWTPGLARVIGDAEQEMPPMPEHRAGRSNNGTNGGLW